MSSKFYSENNSDTYSDLLISDLLSSHSEILGQESERGAAHKLKPKSLLTSCRSRLDVQSSRSYLRKFPALDTNTQSIGGQTHYHHQNNRTSQTNPNYIPLTRPHGAAMPTHPPASMHSSSPPAFPAPSPNSQITTHNHTYNGYPNDDTNQGWN